MLAKLAVELLEVGQGVDEVGDAGVEPLHQVVPGEVVQKRGHVCCAVRHEDGRGKAAGLLLFFDPREEGFKALFGSKALDQLSVLVNQLPSFFILVSHLDLKQTGLISAGFPLGSARRSFPKARFFSKCSNIMRTLIFYAGLPEGKE